MAGTGKEEATSREGGVDRATEAKDLATDAVEAVEGGDKDEGKFLADAARDLDRKAADEVLKGKA